MTSKYDPNNKEHVRIRKGIEAGNALPDIPHTTYVIESFKKAGFEIIEECDRGEQNEDFPIPWYDPLEGKWTLRNFQFTRFGNWVSGKFLSLLELVRLVPRGASGTSRMLKDTAVALVEGGRLGIFTPSYFVLCRKPEKEKKKKNDRLEKEDQQ
jgi:sterol 24-C-methyltransferase